MTEKGEGNDEKKKKRPTKKLLKSSFDGYEYKGFQIKVKLELVGYDEYEPVKVCCPLTVYKLFRKLRESDKERLFSIHLDRELNVIGVELISQGPVDRINVVPREVFKSAFLSSAYGIILVHCHPSGNPLPTIEDTRVTEKLQDAGNFLGVQVFDHVIIGRGTLYSFQYDVQKLKNYHSKSKKNSTDYIG